VSARAAGIDLQAGSFKAWSQMAIRRV